MSTVQKAAVLFGGVFILIGILGFIPGLAPNGHLFGVFHVNALHNVVHLMSGVIAIWAGTRGAHASKVYFQAFGVVYALVAVLGIITGHGYVLGVLANNMADVGLHIVIAVAALALGFVGRAETRQQPLRTTRP